MAASHPTAQAASLSVADDADMVVTLLGTGSPGPNPSRFSAATLVQAGPYTLLFDAGRGCTIRLRQLGVQLGVVSPVFLTHFHSDHTNGLADLWMTGYIQTAYAKRQVPMTLIGPTGTRRLARRMREAFQDDFEIRREDEGVPMSATQINAKEFSDTGTCFTAKDLTVTSFKVDHGPKIKHTYGYRVEHRGRCVVISGDTRYDPMVAKYGKGADLLIHEVCAAAPEVLKYLNNRAVAEHHTSPHEAGRIFAQAQPRMAAYTHIIQLTRRGSTTEPDTGLIQQATRQAYSGPLVIGNDLTRFEIGDSIRVREWNHQTQSYA